MDSHSIEFQRMFLARQHCGGCLVIPQQPITQPKALSGIPYIITEIDEQEQTTDRAGCRRIYR
jgi:hypothetical protein